MSRWLQASAPRSGTQQHMPGVHWLNFVLTNAVGLNCSHVCEFFSESFLETVTDPQAALSLGRDGEELR